MSSATADAGTEAKLREYLNRAMADLRSVRRRLEATEARTREPIAIVSMACRYPGGITSPEDLWDAVEAGRDLVGPFPTDRGWDLAGLHDPSANRRGTSYVDQGGFLNDVAAFDAPFFGISPREALAMDPQQRQLLELVWECLERARLDPTALRGSDTGIFLGATDHDYGRGLSGVPETVDGNVLIGRSGAISAGRVAYVLDLRGPCLTIDTMCSSSLVALHEAAQSLRRGEASLALAAGTTVMSTPEGFVEFSTQNALARDGRCKAFADGADGTGWAEGVGVLLLERLSDAERNRHPVLAVLRGSAINQDGASNGLTAPSGRAQREVIRGALEDARLSGADVDVVEAHGTGTPLGDPVEANALLDTYGRERPADDPVWLGSLKSNLGHAAAAAGVGGVIKVVMAMRAGTLPRTLHADQPSTKVDWERGGVRLLRENRPWDGEVRRAAVSAFGASGTNAHAILESAPIAPAPAPAPASAGESSAGANPAGEDAAGANPVPGDAVLRDGPAVWTVSGRSADAVRAQAGRLRRHLRDRPGLRPADVGWSLATTRPAFDHRVAVVGDDPDTLLDALAAAERGTEHPALIRPEGAARARPRVAFVFPGQGSQWAGMARRLLDDSPAFAASMRECDAAVRAADGPSVLDLIRNDAGDAAGDAAWLGRVDEVQPALWAVLVSLARLWRAAGVEPDAVVGHSQGEIAAACVAGALTTEDAARIIVLRSRAIAGLDAPGGMLSVALGREAALAYVAGAPGLTLAAANGAGSGVLSGPPADLDEAERALAADGVRVKRIPVGYASHSPLVEPLEPRIRAELASVRPVTGAIPFCSTVTGDFVDTATLDAAYWYRNLRERVEFAAATARLADAGFDTFVEISPHPVLLPALTETLGDEATLTGTLHRGDGGAEDFLRSVAALVVSGVRPDPGALYGGSAPVTLDLPTYAFQHRRYWLADEAAPPAPSAAVAGDDEFWAAVDSGDPSSVAELLGIPGEADALARLLPALGGRSGRRRDDATAAAWRYAVGWEPLDVPASAPLTGRWLVLTAEDTPPLGAGGVASLGVGGVADPGAEVAGALADGGAEPVLVPLPAAADRAAVAAALAAALTSAAAAGDWRGVVFPVPADSVPSGSVSSGSVSSGSVPSGSVPSGAGAGDRGVLPRALTATLAVVNGLRDAGITAPLWVLTRNVAAPEVRTPAGAAVWGLGRVVALEHPATWGGLVDLPDTLGDRGAHLLRAALGGALPSEDQVAIRPSGLRARRLHPVPPQAGAAAEPGGAATVAGDCALLIGGTGGIGQQVARRLADRGTTTIVLVSRRGQAGPDLAAAVAAAGGTLRVETADAADPAALARVRAALDAAGTPVTSVWHLAGGGTLEPVATLDEPGFDATARAKIGGADAIDAVFDDPAIPVVLFSSISAVWGSAEHGAYAAANAYLDAVAEHRRARGLPTWSIDWGIWDPAEGGGMAADLVEDLLRDRGVPFMSPRVAFRALDLVLADPRPVQVVADVAWDRFAPVFTSARPSRLLDGVPAARAALGPADGAAATATDSGPGLAELPGPQRRKALAAAVTREIAAVLRLADDDPVEPDRPFRELGFDSLTAVELRRRLQAATGLRLPAAIVFDYPTVARLVIHLDTLLAPPAEPAGDPVPAAPEPDGGIDAMDADELIRAALHPTRD